jgi:hypothetical protein
MLRCHALIFFIGVSTLGVPVAHIITGGRVSFPLTLTGNFRADDAAFRLVDYQLAIGETGSYPIVAFAAIRIAVSHGAPTVVPETVTDPDVADRPLLCVVGYQWHVTAL